MKNYKEQSTCFNCKHSRDNSLEYDYSDMRCSFDSKKPVLEWPETEWRYLKWVSTLPKVSITGICDNYEKKEKKK